MGLPVLSRHASSREGGEDSPLSGMTKEPQRAIMKPRKVKGVEERFVRRSLEWRDGVVCFLDQTRLPQEVCFIETTDYRQVAEAIRRLAVRGAPLIGAAAAFGVALAALHEAQGADWVEGVRRALRELASTRPTAVNLFWALERMERVLERSLEAGLSRRAIQERLVQEARAIAAEDEEAHRRLGQWGAALLPDGARVLTHCNTGSLATMGWGTALGVVRAAVAAGKRIHVWATETRPLLQGARLTTWELLQDGIPVTLITDGMAGTVMAQGKVDLVLVGADRITARGDVANKIGTYTLAVLAHHHGLPFYVAAPLSSVDFSLASGEAIPIEERSPEEVRTWRGVPTAPKEVPVYNPAFDVTPAELITAIITEAGVAFPPLEEALARWRA